MGHPRHALFLYIFNKNKLKGGGGRPRRVVFLLEASPSSSSHAPPLLPLSLLTCRRSGRSPWTEPGEATAPMETEHPARVPFFLPVDSRFRCAGKRPGKARPPWIPSTKLGVHRPAGLSGPFPVLQPPKSGQMRKPPPPPF